MPDRPNILLIFTDQHRLSAVGAYGETPCRTPHIDRLAQEGVLFERTYTACPVCSPARGTVMTGLFPHTHGITSNVHNLGCSVHEIPDQPHLLSRRLEAAGYALGYSGKWHLGTDSATCFGGANRPSLPRDVGFEGQNFPGHGGGGFSYPEYKAYLAERGLEHRVKPWSEPTKDMGSVGELAGPVESTVPYFLAQNTIDMIDRFQDRGSPFFIWHNFWGPHGPYYAPAEFIEPYRNVGIPPWPNYEWPSRAIPGPHHTKIHPDTERLTWDDWATAIRYYYAFTTLIDSQIGRIMAHLEAVGALSNTIVIFTSDHGETIGSHGGLMDKGWHHFEETHRIPFIVRFPDGSHAGGVRRPFVSTTDIYPTILEMAGTDWDADTVHGRSLLPLISDPEIPWRETVGTEFGGVNSLSMTQRTLRYEDLKYGYNCCCEDELYDLAMDPHETRNLIHHPGYRDAAADMRSRLVSWMEETGDPARRMFTWGRDYYPGG
ncbi:MAG: sulfatase-like hydrolase/transferase [Candidatus Latescibacteria bacterium]|jgi:arylsulfatase A-like enzyme|nr:sulfatase-like hydrolase/transferase [Candidatus Latescibacterota bacterium]